MAPLTNKRVRDAAVRMIDRAYELPVAARHLIDPLEPA